MADIRIEREHALGDQVDRFAQRCADELRKRFGLDCTLEAEGELRRLRFSGTGVNGEMNVRPDGFDLLAKLGMFLAPMAGTLQNSIAGKLDRLLAEIDDAA